MKNASMLGGFCIYTGLLSKLNKVVDASSKQASLLIVFKNEALDFVSRKSTLKKYFREERAKCKSDRLKRS